MAGFVAALSESTQTPLAMGGLLGLAVLSTCFQKRYTVEITPNWSEPLCLYGLIVAKPAERKSAVFSAMMKPLYSWQTRQNDLHAGEIAQNRAEREILERRLEVAKKRAAGDSTLKQEALDLAAQVAEFEDLHQCRLLCDDVTAEKLAVLMEQQGECMTLASAEGGVFDSMMGRYSRQPNVEIFLKSHASDFFACDRLGRPPVTLKRPRLTMAICCQPDVLREVTENNLFRGRRLVARFLFGICDSRVGHRKITTPPIPEPLRNGYYNFVDLCLGDHETGVVRLSSEADSVRVIFQESVEKRLDTDWEYMADWGGKLTGAIVRIAALLHLAEYPAAEPISGPTMARAVAIGDFFGKHTEAAYQIEGGAPDADAKYLLKRILTLGASETTKRELHQKCRGRYQHPEDMELPLRRLEEMGYIRVEQTFPEDESRVRRGRPSEKIKISPYTQKA